jgi:hypothetical protein
MRRGALRSLDSLWTRRLQRQGRRGKSVFADHDLGGLYDGLHGIAFFQVKVYRRSLSDRRHNLLPSGQAHDDGRHHDSVIDPNYDALELVPCAESHCRDANWPGCGFRRSVSAPQSL